MLDKCQEDVDGGFGNKGKHVVIMEMVEVEAGADMQPLLDKRKGKWLHVGGA